MWSVAGSKLTLQLCWQMSTFALPSNTDQFQTRRQIMAIPNMLSPLAPLEKAPNENAAGEPLKVNARLLGATLVAALGGLLFGFDTIVISGCQNQLKALFQLDSFQQGFMTASAIIGTVIGRSEKRR